MISIVTYADLGTLVNNKTPGMEPLLEMFDERNQLQQVICRLEKRSPFTNTIQALPWWQHAPLGLLSKATSFNKRAVEEKIFDKNASKELESANVTLFHPARFVRTLRRAKSYNSICVGIATIGHQTYAKRLKQVESKRFDIGLLEEYSPRDWQKHYREFDYIIALSDFVKKTFVKSGYPEGEIFIAPTDIDTEKFSPLNRKESLSDGFNIIFMASSIWLLKGLQYLLDAWEWIDIPKANLHIFGKFVYMPSSLRKKMKRQISEDNSIIRHGIVDNPEYYMKRADAMVQPSLNEGLSKVLLESMACGLPTISTEHSRGIVEDGESGIVVPIRDPQAIAENIERLYEDKELRKRLGKSARQAVLNKPSYAESVWEAYQEIIEREGLE
jgi:glycosyltransferase involved in cell wall biosynthesis